MTIDRARQARELFRTLRSGVLSSHSTKLPGYPYGSALPYATDHAGRPVLLISHLAEHTHNVGADARASFLVADLGPDVQTSARATLLGNARQVVDAALEERYLRFFPEHARYLKIGGFAFWTIEPCNCASSKASAASTGSRRTRISHVPKRSRESRRLCSST